jgi:energy-coupling factor transporter transmembrane protein EcfT
MIPFHGSGRGEHKRLIRIVHASPLRQVDPRVKLEVSSLVALAVMLPLGRLAVFWLVFAALMFPARLAGEMFYQIRRIAWILVVLFLLDWLTIGFEFAVLITLRFSLVVSAFVVFFATTRPEEFRLALERLGLPYPYAFSLSLAFLSIALMNEEWYTIHEAQRSRGAWEEKRGRLYARIRFASSKTLSSIKDAANGLRPGNRIVGRHRPDFCLALGKRSYHDTLAI